MEKEFEVKYWVTNEEETKIETINLRINGTLLNALEFAITEYDNIFSIRELNVQ